MGGGGETRDFTELIIALMNLHQKLETFILDRLQENPVSDGQTDI